MAAHGVDVGSCQVLPLDVGGNAAQAAVSSEVAFPALTLTEAVCRQQERSQTDTPLIRR